MCSWKAVSCPASALAARPFHVSTGAGSTRETSTGCSGPRGDAVGADVGGRQPGVAPEGCCESGLVGVADIERDRANGRESASAMSVRAVAGIVGRHNGSFAGYDHRTVPTAKPWNSREC